MHADGKSTLASVSKWNSRKVNWRTGWPIPAIYISFSSILNALSYVINLFSCCSFQLLSENSFEDVELPVRAENRRCIQSIKGELQCQNKLILFERPFKILQNETKIIKIGQAVLEIFKLNVELPVRAENRRCIQSIKGELQCQNKLILFERPFKILQNETKIIKIGQAVLEIFKFKDWDLDNSTRKYDRRPKMLFFSGFAQTEEQ